MAESHIEIINDPEAFNETLFELAGNNLANQVLNKLEVWRSTYHNSEEMVLVVLTNNPLYLGGVTPSFAFLVVTVISRPADMRKSRTLFGEVLNLTDKCLVGSRVKDLDN